MVESAVDEDKVESDMVSIWWRRREVSVSIVLANFIQIGVIKSTYGSRRLKEIRVDDSNEETYTIKRVNVHQPG